MRKLTIVILVGVLWASQVHAQRTNGRLSGVIADTSGAVVPEASVTATSVTTGAAYKTVSDIGGFYLLNNLAPDEYRLEVEKQGFRTYVRGGIILGVEQGVTVNIELTLGKVTESVNVAATPTQVNTVSSTIATEVTPEMAVALPLNGRNVLQLMAVAPDSGPSDAITEYGTMNNPNALVAVSSSGGRGDSVNFYLDGAQDEDSYSSMSNAYPNPDAIKEFSYETNSYSAKYGGRGGGVMNAVTKNGTNQFHGSAFEYVRYFSLNARNFFASTQDGLKRNQFGGTIGGPIQKDKTFFFFSAQGTTLRSLPTENYAIVPTAAERGGDFSSVSKALVNPFTGAAYTNNFVDPATWNPVAANFLKLVPVGAGPTGLTYYTTSTHQNEKQYMGRMDRNFGNKFRVYGTYLFDSWNTPNIPQAGNILTRGYSLYTRSQFGSLNFSYSLTPALMSTLTLGLSRRYGMEGASPGGPSWADLGCDFPTANPSGGKELYLVVSGYFDAAYAISKLATPATTGDIQNNWSYAKGSHTLEFGVEWDKAKQVVDGDPSAGGRFWFSNRYSGNNLVDFLIGRPSQFREYAPFAVGLWRPLWGLYANDSWKATRKLSLSLGVRWNPFYPSAGAPGGTGYFEQNLYNEGVHSTAYPNLPPGWLVGGFDKGIPPLGTNPIWAFLTRAWDSPTTSVEMVRRAFEGDTGSFRGSLRCLRGDWDHKRLPRTLIG
jgi:hypothetical protein